MKRRRKRKILTFENEGVSHDPDVVKCPRNFTESEKYPTGNIREDGDSFGMMVMPIFLSWGDVEPMPVSIR